MRGAHGAGRAIAALLLAAALLAPGAPAFPKEPQKKAVHGAIALNRDSRAVGYAYDFRTAHDAKRAALTQCGEPRCEVVASFTNGCAAAAAGRGKPVTATGVTRDEAETKALRKCGKDCAVLAWACTRD